MTEQRTPPVLGLLAVADPGPYAAIRHWRPFPGGASLGEIVQQCNETCSASYRAQPWTSDDRDALTELFDLLPFDLSHVAELKPAQIPTLRFILLDADALARLGAGAGSVVELLKALINKLPPERAVRLAQVSGEPAPASWAAAFAPARVVTRGSGFVSSDDQLAALLLHSCDVYDVIQSGLRSAMRGEAQRGGERPGMARELLEVALDEDLSLEDAGRFAWAVRAARRDRDFTADAGVPDLLREAARSIKQGIGVEDVVTQFGGRPIGGAGWRGALPEPDVGRIPLDETLSRPDVLRDLGGGDSPLGGTRGGGRGDAFGGGGSVAGDDSGGRGGFPGGGGGGPSGPGEGPAGGGGGDGFSRGGGGRSR
jgi:hypothetical protein